MNSQGGGELLEGGEQGCANENHTEGVKPAAGLGWDEPLGGSCNYSGRRLKAGGGEKGREERRKRSEANDKAAGFRS